MKKKINIIWEKYHSMPVAAKAVIWFVACTLLQKCIAFITVPIFTRLMPTKEYGLYSTYLSWYSIITVFCTLNMHNCIYVNEYTKADTQKEKDFAAIPLLSLSVVITMIIFVVYLIFHGWLDKFIGMPFALTCLLFAQILFEPPVSFWSMQQRFEYKYVILVIRTIVMVILNAVLGIFFVTIAAQNEAIYRACSIVLVQIIFGGYFYLYFIKRANKVFSMHEWGHALKVQLPLLPHSLSLTLLSSADRIMITNMVSAEKSGIYSVAYSAGYVINILKSSIVDALRPWMYEKIKIKDYVSLKKTVNILMIFITLVTVAFTALAPEIIYIMAPKEYHEAIYVIPPIAASSFFTFLYQMFAVFGMYYEKTGKIMWASISGAALNLILNAICIPLFGYIAAAYTTLVCYMFFSFAHYIIMKKICKNEEIHEEVYDTKFIMMMSVIVIFESIGFTFVYTSDILRYIIIAVTMLIFIWKRKVFTENLKVMKKKK